MNEWEIFQGDCREVVSLFDDNTFDAILTDPPYELGFMDRDWDKSGISYDPATWQAMLRVLKPGGHMLCFAGTRTFHRITCAIEDGGFQIRDCLMWLYGSGFPKSHNVGLAIDKAKGGKDRGKAVATALTKLPYQGGQYGQQSTEKLPSGQQLPAYEPQSDEAKQWDGWGTNLKPAWEPIILARKPLDEKTIVANVLEHGTGALNIDATRIHGADSEGKDYTVKRLKPGATPNKTGGNWRPENDDHLPWEKERVYKGQTKDGRWPANLTLSHSEDCICVGKQTVKGRTINRFDDGAKPFGKGAGHDYTSEDFPDDLVEIWACVPGCPIRMLDDQVGDTGNKWKKNYGEQYAEEKRQYKGGTFAGGGYLGNSTYSDAGGPSRYFYCSKASKKERTCDGQVDNKNPCIKPLDLLRYLVRLITPPGGIVLDPFCGSASGGVACIAEGFDYVGIDVEELDVEVAKERCTIAEKDGN